MVPYIFRCSSIPDIDVIYDKRIPREKWSIGVTNIILNLKGNSTTTVILDLPKWPWLITFILSGIEMQHDVTGYYNILVTTIPLALLLYYLHKYNNLHRFLIAAYRIQYLQLLLYENDRYTLMFHH